MNGALILLGDLTDEGGEVVAASDHTEMNGIGIARKGDRVRCSHGDCFIATGDETMLIDGLPAARNGDKTGCGAVLIASQIKMTSWSALGNQSQLAAVPVVSDAEVSPPVEEATDAQAPLSSLAILASGAYTQYGESVENLLNAVTSRALTYELDPTLVNEKGLPILTGRIAGLDEQNQQAQLAAWEIEHQRAPVDWTSEQLRSIATSTEVIRQLLQEANKHPLLPLYLEEESPRQKALIELPTLSLTLLHPERWNEQVCEAVQDWFASFVRSEGWPEEKLSITLMPQQYFTQAAQVIERTILEAEREPKTVFNMIVSCTSCIDETLIDDWSSFMASLLGDKHNQTAVPSEAACGLLVADNLTASLFESLRITALHKPLLSEVDLATQSAEDDQKSALVDLVSDALESSKLSPERVRFVAADTAGGGENLSVLFNIGKRLFPDLNVNEQFFSATSQCGVVGKSAGLLGLALGHAVVKQTPNNAVVFVSHMDDNKRAAIVLNTYQNIASTADV